MKLLERLLGKPEPSPEPQPDPLRDLIETAQAQQDDAWQEINTSRARRGERPIGPDYGDLIRRREDHGRDRP